MKSSRIGWYAGACVSVVACVPAQAQNASATLLDSAYLTVANSSTLNPQQLTIEAIIRPTGSGYGNSTDAFGAAIVNKSIQNAGGSSLVAWGLYWSPVTQKVVGDIGHIAGSSSTTIVSNRIVPVGSIAHVALTFNGAAVNLYINGELDRSIAANGSFIFSNPSDPILIGASNFCCGFTRRFQGDIDNVRLWSGARTAAEIAASTTCLAVGPQSGLLASWVFNEGGTTAADVSGNGLDATWVGPARYGVDHGGQSVVVGQNPAPALMCPGGLNSISVAGFGGNVTYQWQVADPAAPGGWKNLNEGTAFTVNGQSWGSATGVTSRQCLFSHGSSNAPSSISARCVLTSSCGSVNSNPAAVAVCPSDFNCDNIVDFFDYLDFVAAFSANEPGADFNADTVLDFFDYLDFVAAFAGGC